MGELITAIITGVVTLGVCLINNHYMQAKTLSLLEYKLGELEKKVDKHNSVIERTYKLEELTAIQEEKLKSIKEKIDNLLEA